MQLLNIKIPSDLTIIDGTYEMERGPSVWGTAYRKDIIIASTDLLAADMVGAAILGKNPSEIPHLVEFAKLKGRSLDMKSIEVKGEKVEDVAENRFHETDGLINFKRRDIKGIKVTFPDNLPSLCSYCWINMEAAHIIFSKDNPGWDLGGLEICVGETYANKESKKVLLHGDCAIKANKDIKSAVAVKRCPPKILNYLPSLMKITLNKERVIKNNDFSII